MSIDTLKNGINSLGQVRNFKQAAEWLRLGPSGYTWMREYAKKEVEDILANDWSEFGSTNIDHGIGVFAPTRIALARNFYSLYVEEIGPELDKQLNIAEQAKCAEETRILTSLFISATEPPQRYEHDFSPATVDGRVKSLMELNEMYLGGVSSELAEQIKEAADYQKNYFRNPSPITKTARKVLHSLKGSAPHFK